MASAAAIAAGLGQAFQDINRQNLAQQEVNLRKSAQEFEQQAYTQQQTDLAAARGALLDAWQPPPKVQAPMPGTPSQPMMQAFGAPGGMPGMLPPQALSPGAPPPPMGMGMPPGPPPGVGAPPMMPQGRPDGPPGTLIMNPGLSPAQRQMAQADMQRTGGAPPAQPPQPFTASPQAQGAQLPGAPAQAGVAAPPPRDGMMIPDQMLSVPQLVERLNENKRLTPNQRGLALSLAFPMIQQQQTQEYKEAQLQLKTQDEILKYTREKMREQEQALRDIRDERRVTAMEQSVGVRRSAEQRLETKAAGGTAAGGLTPEAVSDAAKQFNMTGTMPQMGWDKNSRQQILNEAARQKRESGQTVNDAVEAQSEFKALQSTQRGILQRSSAIEGMSKKIDNDMITLEKEIDTGNLGGPKFVNTPINKLRGQLSDPSLARLQLAAQVVGTEYERMITNGTLSIAQLHEGAREDAQRLLNGNMSPAEMRAVMTIMKKEIGNQRKAWKDQLSEVSDSIKGLGKAGGEPSGVREFKTEADAKAANLPKGTKIKVNGVEGTWQ